MRKLKNKENGFWVIKKCQSPEDILAGYQGFWCYNFRTHNDWWGELIDAFKFSTKQKESSISLSEFGISCEWKWIK